MVNTILEVLFWVCATLIVWTQLGYAAALAVLTHLFADPPAPAHTAASPHRDEHPPTSLAPPMPSLSLIVAAHDEESVIATKVANALALDYPRELLEVIVTCDGCTDATAERAREAGADIVLELTRGGKIRAQDAAVERARGEIVAFSDANALWEPDAARVLVGAFADRHVGYAAGRCASYARRAPGRPTRRGCTGAMRWRCAEWSRGSPRSPQATARSTRLVATPTSWSIRSWATTCRSPSTW